MRRQVAWIAMAGLLAGGIGTGMALAQGKPPVLGAPGGGKPGPAEAPPPAARDKFAAPPPAPAAPPAARADKFAAPLPAVPPPPAATTPPAAEPPAAGLPGEPDSLTRLRAMLGRDVTLTYRTLAPLDPATGGVRLSGVSLAHAGTTIGIEELTLDRAGEDRIGEAVATGVTIGGGPSTGLIGRVQLGGFRLRRPPPGEQPAPGDLGLDLLRLEGLAVQGDAAFSIGELTVEDWATGRAGRFTLTGLDVLTPGLDVVDRIRFGRIALRGYDMPTMLAALLARRPPPAPPNEVALEIEDVAVTQDGARRGRLDSLRLSAETPAGGVAGAAQSGRLAVRGLAIAGVPALDAWLQRFGYTELSGDITLDARVDPAAERLDLTSFAIAARGMGGLGLSMQLEGVTSDPAQAAANAERMRVAGATLRYVDQSLYGRWVADQARQQRLPEARLREQYANFAATAVTQGSRDAGPLAPSLAAVQRFLRGQAQELELSLRPPAPVPLNGLQGMAVQGPAELQRQLGLSVTAR